jgi:hypothetical protein
LFHEILDLDQQLRNPTLQDSELDSLVQRRHTADIQHRNTLNQISLLEQTLLDQPEVPITEQERQNKINANIDWEEKAKVDAMNTTPSYSQYMRQLAQDREHQAWVDSLSPREKILQHAGLLNRDGSTVRPITQADEFIIRHALEHQVNVPPNLGIAFGN